MLVGKFGVIDDVDPILPEVTLYGGEVTVRFEPIAHRYEVRDRGMGMNWFAVPSVTRVLGLIDKSKPLMNWATRCGAEKFRELIHPGTAYTAEVIEQIARMIQFAHEEKKERAGDIGHEVHEWVENYLVGLGGCPVPPTDPQARSACSAARKFILEHNIIPVAVEKILYSRMWRVIGTTDLCGAVCRMSDSLCILDWKTSNSTDNPAYEWQLAAYASMWEEMTGQRVDDRYLVRLDKENSTASPRQLPREDVEKDWLGFLGLLAAHNRLQTMEA
jgi:PD-(D/E)XK nuclease superfamily